MVTRAVHANSANLAGGALEAKIIFDPGLINLSKSMDNDKRTASGSKLFLFIESLRGLMNSRIGTEYVSIESGRDHELLIVIF